MIIYKNQIDQLLSDFLLSLQRLNVNGISSKPCGFFITNLNHAVAVVYNPTLEHWIFIDVNQSQCRYFLNIKPLIDVVMFAFTNDDSCVCSFEMFIVKAEEKLWQTIFADWEKSSIWIKINTIDATKAQYKDKLKNTLLFQAIDVLSDTINTTKIVKTLLANKADVNVKNYYGETPLHMAVLRNKLGTVELLLEHGADINAVENDGKTALRRLIFMENPIDVAKRLLKDNNIDVNKADNQGCSPLLVAVENNQIELVKLLIAHGANVNQVDNLDRTPFSVAINKGNMEIIFLLIDHMASLVSSNHKGQSYIAPSNATNVSHNMSHNVSHNNRQIALESPLQQSHEYIQPSVGFFNKRKHEAISLGEGDQGRNIRRRKNAAG